MTDLPTTAPEQLALSLLLTCDTCQTTYAPSAEAVARGRLGCPDPDCGGWTFSSALSVPSTTTGGAR